MQKSKWRTSSLVLALAFAAPIANAKHTDFRTAVSKMRSLHPSPEGDEVIRDVFGNSRREVRYFLNSNSIRKFDLYSTDIADEAWIQIFATADLEDYSSSNTTTLVSRVEDDHKNQWINRIATADLVKISKALDRGFPDPYEIRRSDARVITKILLLTLAPLVVSLPTQMHSGMGSESIQPFVSSHLMGLVSGAAGLFGWEWWREKQLERKMELLASILDSMGNPKYVRIEKTFVDELARVFLRMARPVGAYFSHRETARLLELRQKCLDALSSFVTFAEFQDYTDRGRLSQVLEAVDKMQPQLIPGQLQLAPSKMGLKVRKVTEAEVNHIVYRIYDGEREVRVPTSENYRTANPDRLMTSAESGELARELKSVWVVSEFNPNVARLESVDREIPTDYSFELRVRPRVSMKINVERGSVPAGTTFRQFLSLRSDRHCRNLMKQIGL